MDTMKIPTMYTIKQAAAATGLSYTYLRNLCINNQVVHVRTGKKYLINMEKLINKLNGEE